MKLLRNVLCVLTMSIMMAMVLTGCGDDKDKTGNDNVTPVISDDKENNISTDLNAQSGDVESGIEKNYPTADAVTDEPAVSDAEITPEDVEVQVTAEPEITEPDWSEGVELPEIPVR